MSKLNNSRVSVYNNSPAITIPLQPIFWMTSAQPMAWPDRVTQKAISVLSDDMTMMTDCQEGAERRGKHHKGKTVEERAGLNSASRHFQSGCQEEKNCPVAKAGLRECR